MAPGRPLGLNKPTALLLLHRCPLKENYSPPVKPSCFCPVHPVGKLLLGRGLPVLERRFSHPSGSCRDLARRTRPRAPKEQTEARPALARHDGTTQGRAAVSTPLSAARRFRPRAGATRQACERCTHRAIDAAAQATWRFHCNGGRSMTSALSAARCLVELGADFVVGPLALLG